MTGAVVLGDTTQEGITVEMALVHDVSTHTTRRGLTVSTCHAESLHLLGEDAQHLSTLHHLETILAEILQFCMLLRNGRGIDHQTLAGILAGMGNLVDIFFIVFQSSGQLCRGLVIAGNHQATANKIAGDGTHADATDANEIYGFYIFCFHYSV